MSRPDRSVNVPLAEGLNLGLRKMAEATNTHDYWQLSRLARWHVESEAMNRALAIVVAAQGKLPMSRVWGWARQHRAMVSFSDSAAWRSRTWSMPNMVLFPASKRILT